VAPVDPGRAGAHGEALEVGHELVVAVHRGFGQQHQQAGAADGGDQRGLPILGGGHRSRTYQPGLAHVEIHSSQVESGDNPPAAPTQVGVHRRPHPGLRDDHKGRWLGLIGRRGVRGCQHRRGLAPVRGAQFGDRGLDMPLDGGHADLQTRGDLRARQPHPDQPEYVALTRG